MPFVSRTVMRKQFIAATGQILDDRANKGQIEAANA
jgi:hypothetical protein